MFLPKHLQQKIPVYIPLLISHMIPMRISISVRKDIKCEPMENGIIIAIAGEKGRVPIVFNVILHLHAKAAKAGIYVQRVKPMDGI